MVSTRTKNNELIKNDKLKITSTHSPLLKKIKSIAFKKFYCWTYHVSHLTKKLSVCVCVCVCVCCILDHYDVQTGCGELTRL